MQASSHLKRIAVSLFNFLDKEKKGTVTFEEMLRWVIPAATDEDIHRMITWVKQEENTIENGIVNYKLPKYVDKKVKGVKTLTFTQIKDFLHIFVDLDDDNSSSLEMHEVLNHFREALTLKDVEDVFAEWDTLGHIVRDKLGKPLKLKQTINLEEYIKMMLPPENFFIPEYMLSKMSVDYVEKLWNVKKLKERAGLDPRATLIVPSSAD